MPTRKPTIWKSVFAVAVMLGMTACAVQNSGTNAVVAHGPNDDMGLRWVKNAVEYQAVTTQIYAQATADLAGYINDKSWSAMPGHSGHSELPPAVILDVDETVVSNVDFQLTLEPPFENHKHDRWSRNYHALAVRGVKQFVDAAREAGAVVFFLTNRPCEERPGVDDPCPQKQTTVDDIREAGISVDAAHVSLARERPEWDREKLLRREHIAESHRVIMLIGDDYGDFVPCVRSKVVAPCTEPATRASRRRALETYNDYWGAGWYILPNPMHGSWTSVR